jgi:hypothetical protein
VPLEAGLCAAVEIEGVNVPINAGDGKEDSKFQIERKSKEPAGRRRYRSTAEALAEAEVWGDLRFQDQTHCAEGKR